MPKDAWKKGVGESLYSFRAVVSYGLPSFSCARGINKWITATVPKIPSGQYIIKGSSCLLSIARWKPEAPRTERPRHKSHNNIVKKHKRLLQKRGYTKHRTSHPGQCRNQNPGSTCLERWEVYSPCCCPSHWNSWSRSVHESKKENTTCHVCMEKIAQEITSKLEPTCDRLHL